MRCSEPPRNIVLIGFMGAGKTTVGRLLAQELNMPFVDVDAEIERAAGLTIPEIFAQRGEGEFRRLEATVLNTVLARTGQVVATGGGAVTNPASLAQIVAHNFAVWLAAPLPVLLARAEAQGGRPLLADSEQRERAAVRYEERLPLYSQARLTVAADLPPTQSCEVIKRYWNCLTRGLPTMQSVPVPLGERSYHVHVGVGLLQRLADFLPGRPGRLLLVSDRNVADLYLAPAVAALRSAGWEVHSHVQPASEEAKTLSSLSAIYSACVQAGLDRKSPIVALGGGVVGDVAGLAAATYMRGVPFAQVPTTLLAQVDSSVGGKVAVNLPEGKNLVGAFYQPQVVVADVGLLASLPERELRSGLAEVIKHGVIADERLFNYVAGNQTAIWARDPEALATCVVRSCEIKGEVVAADEKEEARREVLNFGHTMGHAIETVTGYRRYTHGEAVAIGMVTAARLSEELGFRTADTERLVSLLLACGLPVNAPDLAVSDLLAAMMRDKKVRDGKLRFALCPRLGAVTAGCQVTPAAVEAALQWQNSLTG